ncbi:LptF/LptG family permease [Asticcacaulis sp. BYS171W]|uniref:LptF/LptG family permease n=1 Tax=Asticcacaulis aquaticus TaxID=2984212 RepID=A0ABT5HNY8_9CAUL|nr:LptF/LptG family permease [Asticcacaulis aquaticus]MDC7681667.1 LptF/LptG family permease [Asticcacaulis aquaticus]
MNRLQPLLTLLSFLNPWRNRRLETYVLLRCLMGTLTGLVVIASIIFLIDYVEISKSLGQRADLNSFQIIGLLLLKSPNIILVLLPFAFLFGTLSAFVGLNRRSELIAMRAAGVSAWRFILPATGMAAIIGVLTITVLNPIATVLSDRYDQFNSGLEQSDTRVKRTDIFLRQGEVSKQTVIHARTQDARGTLLDATFWTYTLAKDGTPTFEGRIDAKEAVLKTRNWLLKNAREAKPGEPAQYFNQLSIDSNLDARRAFDKYAAPQSTNFWELPATIFQIETSGFSAASYILRLHQLLATPLMFAGMTALGAAFSLRLMRIGGLARLTLSGVGLGFIIFFLNQLCGSMGKAEVIPIFLAGWATPAVSLLAAMTLLVYTEDG